MNLFTLFHSHMMWQKSWSVKMKYGLFPKKKLTEELLLIAWHIWPVYIVWGHWALSTDWEFGLGLKRLHVNGGAVTEPAEARRPGSPVMWGPTGRLCENEIGVRGYMPAPAWQRALGQLQLNWEASESPVCHPSHSPWTNKYTLTCRPGLPTLWTQLVSQLSLNLSAIPLFLKILELLLFPL